MSEIQLESSWKQALQAEFEKSYFQNIRSFLQEEKAKGARILPPGSQIFAAFQHTPLHEVKVVILGQDPYHGPGQANGLCFSVHTNMRIPPSLMNIFKEIQSDLGRPFPPHGDLSSWARQGVLLLNASLTVRLHEANSHSHIGWQQFTDAVIDCVNQKDTPVVFLLWGAYAQSKAQRIDTNKHLVLQAPHPSPLSAHRGFLGCKHFSKTNEFLQKHGLIPIDWNIE